MSRAKKREYKRKMNEYRRAYEKLKEYASELSTSLKTCDNQFEQFPKVYSITAGLKGDVIDNFYNKSMEPIKTNIHIPIDNAYDSHRIISEQAERAYELYLYYKEKYENESDDD